MKRHPALIFDFGNVIAHFDYGRAAAACGSRIGIAGPAFLERIQTRGFGDLLKEYERGALSTPEFVEAFGLLAGLSLPRHEFGPIWTDIFTLNEPLARLIPGLKQAGHTLVLGSNTNALHAERFRVQFAETLEHFDELVLSYQVGALKPSRGFYEACAQAAGVEPSGCVFIDDLPENVAGARATGMRALEYRGVEELTRGLRAEGVEIGPGSIVAFD